MRIKCTLCGSTKGIAYQEIEGHGDTIKAETCDSCRGYVKVLHQHKDPALEPIADDIASLGLDLLVRENLVDLVELIPPLCCQLDAAIISVCGR